MKKAIVVGASSGIGRALAKVLAENNYEVGLVSRRIEKLKELQNEILTKTYVKQIDISKTSEVKTLLGELIEEMGGVGLIVISSGVGFINLELDYEKSKQTIDVNVSGFSAVANFSFNYFRKQKFGHLVGISSIVGIRGDYMSPVYGASKAFVSNYLEALRRKSKKEKLNIYVTEIQPGFVSTPIIEGNEKMFWVASPKEAALQIYDAIKKKKPHVYVLKRWRILALLRFLPRGIYDRLNLR